MVATVTSDVLLPIGAYLGLRMAGVSPVGALTASVLVSTVVAVGEAVMLRRIGTLTLIVLAGTAVTLMGGLLSRDALVLYLRDPLTDVVIAGLAAVGALRGRPFVASIRRDLSPSRAAFDEQWSADAGFRHAHAVASRWWIGGLIALAAVSVALVMLIPFDLAVGVSQVAGAIVIGGLIVLSECCARRAGSQR